MCVWGVLTTRINWDDECIFLKKIGPHMNILFIIKVKILVLTRRLNGSLPIMWIIEPRTISFEHMFFSYSFLEPHLITHHSNIAI